MRARTDIDPAPNPEQLHAGTRRTSSRSPPAACTSAARSATWTRRRGSSARATAASTTSTAASPAARRSARSTASTRASRTARSRSARATRSTREFGRFPCYRDPGQDLDGIGQYLYPGRFSTPKLRLGSHEAAQAPAPRSRPPSSRAAAPGRGRSAARWTRPRRPASPPSTGSTSAPRSSGGLRWMHVPQGAEGHELVLHAGLGDDVRLPLAGRHRRVPGDVLPPGRRRRRLRVGRATSPTRSSSASSCAACTSGARR